MPESLVAISKDAAYKQSVEDTLHQVLENFPSTRSNVSPYNMAISTLSTALLLVTSVRRKSMSEELEMTDRNPGSFPHRVLPFIDLMISCSTLLVYSLTMPERNVESLKGYERRAEFEKQRKAMLSRSDDSSDSVGKTPKLSPMGWSKRYVNRLHILVKEIHESLHGFLAERGPHEIGDSTDPARLLSSRRSVLSWLLRLHLALYCTTGGYAHWRHRLVGLKQQPKPQNISRLINQPGNLSRVAGALMLVNLMCDSAWSSSQWMVQQMVDGDSHQKTASHADLLTEVGSRPEDLPERIAYCGICSEKRLYPATLASCGHIYCWVCLQDWQVTHGECPLCRKPISARDIIPLYNYDSSK